MISKKVPGTSDQLSQPQEELLPIGHQDPHNDSYILSYCVVWVILEGNAKQPVLFCLVGWNILDCSSYSDISFLSTEDYWHLMNIRCPYEGCDLKDTKWKHWKRTQLKSSWSFLSIQWLVALLTFSKGLNVISACGGGNMQLSLKRHRGLMMWKKNKRPEGGMNRWRDGQVHRWIESGRARRI